MPVTGFDHIALPTSDPEAMLSFYKRLGFTSPEEAAWRAGRSPVFSLVCGTNKINVHPPTFRTTLKGPTAVPGCGDLCLVWEGGLGALQAFLAEAGIEVIEGPVDRTGGRGGGMARSVSVYVRDPDRNLLEFMCYGEAPVGRW